MVATLAEKEMSESFGRTICQWTDKLPAGCRPAADAILVTAARAGMDLRDLAALAAELYERSRPELPDEDPGLGFEDRAVRLETTFGGAGVLGGDLTPACAAVVGAVLDALSAPAGARDTRTRAQRYHDGLAEAMRRLLAAGLLPQRAGQPVKALVHMPLGDLIQLDGSSALMQEWAAQVRARWAAHRAAASVSGSDGGAWLDGEAARGAGCDASLTPVVTGEVDPAALEDIVRLSVQLDKLRRRHDHHHDRGGDRTGTGDRTGDGDRDGDGAGNGDGGAAEGTGDGSAAEGAGGGGGPAGPAQPQAHRTRAPPAPGRPWSRRSSARRWACCRVRAGSPRSCAAGSSAPGWAAPACRWMWGCPATSRPRSAARSSCGTSTAASPAAATSPPRAVRCTT